MKVRLLLKRRGLPTNPVYVALYDGDITEIIYTGVRVGLKEWSGKDRVIKDPKSEAFKATELVKAEVQHAIVKLQAEHKPISAFTVKQEYERGEKEKKASQLTADKKAKLGIKSIVSLIDRYVKDELFRFRPSSRKSIDESMNQFKTFLKDHGMYTLEQRDLDRDIISKYERYLLEKKKLSDNTHGKRIKHLRWFLKYINHDITGIKIRSSKKQIISLTAKELEALEGVDVSSSVEWQKAKDLFLLGCYTGLRISDLKRLNSTNTQNGFISLTLVKNNRIVKIPIVSEANKILSNYNYHSPKISEQALNECIKKVCDKAGIKESVSIDETKGGQRISRNVPKHDLISSHIAGKTFITLAPEKWGLSPAEIAAIVGKDLKTLLNSYFNLPGEEARRKMIQMDNSKLKVS